ncbi:MAG: helix-turn-helix transcriptional regulator [Acidobacteriota bacterium]
MKVLHLQQGEAPFTFGVVTTDQRAKSDESKDRPRSAGAIALKMLREHSDLVRRELAQRSGVSERRIGGLERGEQEIEEKDLTALLDGMDLPRDAWSETLEHVERLHWLRVRHLGQRGTIADGHEVAGESELPAWIFESGGRLDVPAVRRELLRAAKVAGRAKERETFDITNLMLLMLARLGDGE